MLKGEYLEAMVEVGGGELLPVVGGECAGDSEVFGVLVVFGGDPARAGFLDLVFWLDRAIGFDCDYEKGRLRLDDCVWKVDGSKYDRERKVGNY